MTSFSRSLSLGLAALLIAGTACAADDRAVQPQPTERQAEKPADKQADLKQCVVDSGGFRMQGKQATYVVELENRCERRLRCRVHLNVTTAFGAVQGQRTLTLAPHAAGEAARKSFALKVKAMGGMAMASRSCEAM